MLQLIQATYPLYFSLCSPLAFLCYSEFRILRRTLRFFGSLVYFLLARFVQFVCQFQTACFFPSW